ncbi:tRNA (adenine(22)-N(1))-methyltransferase [Guggenheimella bovis]
MEAIVQLVPTGLAVVDIGADHCKVSNLLAERGEVVYATEASEGPLKQAEAFKDDRVILSLHDGLKGFHEPVDAAIIAGMGGELIKKILSESFEAFQKLKAIVLQPMQHTEVLREYLLENNFRILKEQIVFENEKFFQIFLVEPGREEPYDIRFFKTSSESPEILQAFYKREIDRYEMIYKKSKDESIIDRLEELKKRL